MRKITDRDDFTRELKFPEDVKRCPECGSICHLYMPDEELGWHGPLAVCRNNYCTYFVNSLEHTRQQMGVDWMYRNCYSYADESWFPVTFTATDNPFVFVPMGDSIVAEINSWNEAVEAWKTGYLVKQDLAMWENMYPDLWRI